MEKVNCPFCFEKIPTEATKCKHCHSQQYDKKELLMFETFDLMKVWAHTYFLVGTSLILNNLFTATDLSDGELTFEEHILMWGLLLVPLVIGFLYIQSNEFKNRSVPNILKSREELKFYLKIDKRISFIFYPSIILLVIALYHTKPNTHDFTAYLKQEETNLPAKIDREKEMLLFTFHSIDTEHKQLDYIGAFNRFFCVYDSSTSKY